MWIAAAQLAFALAPRLDAVVPRPFRVRADGATLVVEHPDGWGAIKSLDWVEHPGWREGETGELSAAAAEIAARAVETILDSVQDDVSEALRVPWPALTPTTMAPSNARADGATVRLWYGPSEAAPTIGFAPIPLAELAGRP